MSARSDVVLRRAAATDGDAVILASLGARLFQQAYGADNDAEDMRLFLDRTFASSVQLAELGDANRVVWLAVWERNPRAIAFYEKWGFRRVGEQRFLVGTDSQRDHVMASTLGGFASTKPDSPTTSA